jgi:hypothetical protein
MKAILFFIASFALGYSVMSQPVKNDERPLPIVSTKVEHDNKMVIKPHVKTHDSKKVIASKQNFLVNKPTDGGEKKKIAGLIKLVQPRKGQAYADRVAETIVKEAKRYNLDPFVVATTAYIESEFSMSSKPCMGIMQIERRTYREHYAKSGLKPMDLEDNIRLGAWELADKAKMSNKNQVALASRGGLSRMWGRYNGAGSRSSYVRRAHLTLKRIKNGNPDEWNSHLKSRGPLWKP